jgi:Tfp pilus assembly protein PilX
VNHVFLKTGYPPGRSRAKLGFSLPFALMLGIVMSLAALAMLAYSRANSIASSAQVSNAYNLAAAEAGIAHYTNFLAQNRNLAPYAACSGWNATTGACDDTAPATTWAIVGPAMAGAGQCATTPAAATLILSQTNRSWQNLDTSDPNRGQFRLVDYTYAPNAGIPANTAPGIGRLTIEGRGSNSTARGVTRLQVDIPVDAGTATGPGLWVQDKNGNTTTVSGTTFSVAADLQDSSCNGGAAAVLSGGVTGSITQTPGVPFPQLPARGSSTPTGAGVYSISAIDNSNDNCQLGPTLTGAVSTLCSGVSSTHTESTLTYIIGANAAGKSIELNGSNPIRVGDGSQNVELYLLGDIELGGNASIEIASGTKLTIYARSDVNLIGNAAVNPIVGQANAEDVQIYVYGGGDVNLSGDTEMKLFLFAPDSEVTQSGNARVRGAIWANNWQGSGDFVVTQAVDFSALQVRLPNNTLDQIASWQQQATSP